MKLPRSTAITVAIVVAAVAAFAFLYGVPSGRRTRRESLRAFRFARNAIGIYPVPVLTVRTWNGSPQRSLLVEVYESGRLVVSARGERAERQLTRDAVQTLLATGKAALGDFSASGCGTRPGGHNSALYVLIDGSWVGSVCRDASAWPPGFETKGLVQEIESHMPGAFGERR